MPLNKETKPNDEKKKDVIILKNIKNKKNPS